MSGLRQLYEDMILGHYQHPRNFGDVERADRRAEGFNPLCGDRINVELRLGEHDRLEDVGFTGSGCAICTASASMMTEGLKGKTPEEADNMFASFQDLVTGRGEPEAMEAVLGKLIVFAGVREFPIRVKCATLPWHTFKAALAGAGGNVSTE